jgi:hypothetical protein
MLLNGKKEQKVEWKKRNPEKCRESKKRSYERRKERIFLKDGRWSEKNECCIKCGTRERAHYGGGFCLSCYRKEHRKPSTKEEKDYHMEYSRRCYVRKKGGIYQYLLDEVKKEIEKQKKEKETKIYKAKKKESNAKERKRRTLKKRKIQKRLYLRERRRTNLAFRLKENISKSIIKRLKKRLSSKEGKSTWDFLPYTVENLIRHLEGLFIEGMTWQNYGEWHIDHKRPDCSFDYKSVDDEDFQECWALKNLQPLWAVDNLKKGGKWDGQ